MGFYQAGHVVYKCLAREHAKPHIGTSRVTMDTCTTSTKSGQNIFRRWLKQMLKQKNQKHQSLGCCCYVCFRCVWVSCIFLSLQNLFEFMDTVFLNPFVPWRTLFLHVFHKEHCFGLFKWVSANITKHSMFYKVSGSCLTLFVFGFGFSRKAYYLRAQFLINNTRNWQWQIQIHW